MPRLIPTEFLAFERFSQHIHGHLADFQALIVKAQIDAAPQMAGERFALATVKIDACPDLRIPSFGRKTGIGNSFLGEKQNERSTVGQRNFGE